MSSVVNDQVTTLNFMYCHEERATALSTGQRMFGLFGVTNAHLLWTREAYPTRAYQTLGNLAPKPGTAGAPAPNGRAGLPEGIAIGDPDDIVDAIKRWESIGVDGLNFILNAQETIPQQEVLDSLRLFAAEVMPQFKSPERVDPPPDSHMVGARPACVGRRRGWGLRSSGRAPDVLVGTAPVEPLAERAVRVERFASETVELPDAFVVLAHFELPYAVREVLLPPSLHPNTPPILTVLAWRCPESPWGAFSLAQLRVGCRSGVRTRGLLLGAAIDNPDAAAALAAGWGLVTRPADVRLRRGYDASSVEVAFHDPAGPTPALRLRLLDPDPLGTRRRPVLGDAHPGRHGPRAPAGAVRARVRRGPLRAGPAPPRPARRDRVGRRPRVPRGPVAASVTAATIVLRPVRFVCRADVTGFEGTEPVDA